MKKSIFSALCLVLLATTTQSAWGAEVTITFKTATQDGSTEIDSSTQSSTVISSGTDYVSGFTSSCSKAYYNGKSGVKLGSKSSAGTLEFNIATAYQSNIKKITIKSAKYGSDTGTLTLYSGSTSLKTGISPGTDFTYTFDTPTTVSSIKLVTSAQRAYITSITIIYETGSTGTTLYLGLFLAAFVAVRACVRRVECRYATFHHIIMSKIDFRSVHFAKECFVFVFCSFLLLDQKKRTKEKSRLWRLRCQKFVVSVSAKSNSLRSDSDLAFRHAQLDF
ncbi:MAG: hypothetical protein MSH41_00005 [Bacteroidales bacterium]|nr:hypothetical protein [Bacteroidales bacterium]